MRTPLSPNDFGFPDPLHPRRQRQPSRWRPIASAIKHLESRLVAGLLVFLPILVTYLVFNFFYDIIASLIDPFVNWLNIPKTHGFDWADLVGIAAILVLTYFVGMLVGWAVIKFAVNQLHDVIGRVPVIGAVYNTTRVGIDFLSDTQEQDYRGVVLIEFPRLGVMSIGLITSNLGMLNGVEEHLAIYVPTTPVPSSGYLVVVASSTVTPTDITVEEAMRIIISGGILAGEIFGDRVSIETGKDKPADLNWLWGCEGESVPPPAVIVPNSVEIPMPAVADIRN